MSDSSKLAFQRLLVSGRRGSLAVLTIGTAEAAAITKSLMNLLKHSNVGFTVYPVVDMDDLRSTLGSLHDAAAVLLAGFGATFDVPAMVDVQAMDVHVVDSTRPVHLANLRCTQERFYLWGRESAEDFATRHFSAKRRRDGPVGRDAWVGAVDPAVEAAYEAREAAGMSMAVELYDVAVLLSKAHEGLLWNAAVGITDLWMRRLISHEAYSAMLFKVKTGIAAWEPTHNRQLLASVSANIDAGVRIDAKARLAVESENRYLPLLRHVSLWEAAWNSTPIAACMSLHYRADSERALQQLLASCGISRDRASRSWATLPKSQKDEVLQCFQEVLKPHLSADEFEVETVERTVEYGTAMSACDVVRLFNALMCSVSHDAPKDEVNALMRERMWLALDVFDSAPRTPVFQTALDAQRLLWSLIADSTGAMMQRGVVCSSSVLHYSVTAARECPVSLEEFGSPWRLKMLAEGLRTTLGHSTKIQRPLMLSAPLTESPPRDTPKFVVSLVCPRDRTATTMRTVQFVIASMQPRVVSAGFASGSTTYIVDSAETAVELCDGVFVELRKQLSTSS